MLKMTMKMRVRITRQRARGRKMMTMTRVRPRGRNKKLPPSHLAHHWSTTVTSSRYLDTACSMYTTVAHTFVAGISYYTGCPKKITNRMLMNLIIILIIVLRGKIFPWT